MRSGKTGRWATHGLLAMVAVVMALGGCDTGNDVENADGDPATIVGAAEEEDFANLVVGDHFEGTAVVTEVVSPHAFTLFDTLVVSPPQLDLAVDERVQVRGTIRSTTIEELESELGVDLAQAVADAHDGELLIVADEVTKVDFPEPVE